MATAPARALEKLTTGITGLDEITEGGLPAGRTTLVCGGPGCGKTLLAMEIALLGCRDRGEPAVFMSFEEPPDQLIANMASLGFDLRALIDAGQLVLDHVRIDAREVHETGEYDLEALFIRLDYAISSIGAKVVVLDTIEALFATLSNEAVLRSELRRLFRWLGERDVTSIVTAERGDRTLTRHGLEEYVSDCVITLDHRVRDEISTRRLRIVKYRGSGHGHNEYPFVLDRHGFSVIPVTSLRLDHDASSERVSTGLDALDDMLGGEGLWRGSSVLLAGSPGTGKTTLSATIAAAACARGERALMLLFEESPAEVIRNLRSVGLNLGQWIEAGLLTTHAERPTSQGLEANLTLLWRLLAEANPSLVVVDAITALAGDRYETVTALRRMIDMIKSAGATAILTSLTASASQFEGSGEGISSLIDAWVMLSNFEDAGERNRGLQVLKARGIAHSNQVREFTIGPGGLHIHPAFAGGGEVLMGTARMQQEARETADRATREHTISRKQSALARRRAAVEAQIQALSADLAAEEAAVEAEIREGQALEHALEGLAQATGALRGGGSPSR